MCRLAPRPDNQKAVTSGIIDYYLSQIECVNGAGCSKSVAQAELCKLQFHYSEQCLTGFELCVVLAECCGVGNVFISNIRHYCGYGFVVRFQ